MFLESLDREQRLSLSNCMRPSSRFLTQVFGLASLTGHDNEEALSVNGNEDVAVLRVDCHRVNPGTLERDVGNKFFGGCIDDAHRSLFGRAQLRRSLRGMSEVIAVGGGIVPDLIGVSDLRDRLANLARSGIQRQAAHTAAYSHQTPFWSNSEAAQRQIEHTAFAFHWEALNRIGQLVRIEDVDAILCSGHILIEPARLTIPNRLFHAILTRRIFVLTQNRSVLDRDESEKWRHIPVARDHQHLVGRVVSQFVHPKLTAGGNLPKNRCTGLGGVGFNDVAGAIASPDVARVIRDDSVWSGAVPEVFGLAGARSAARKLALADEAKKCVRSRVHEVNRIVGAIRQVVFLRGIIYPADVKTIVAVIGWSALDHRNATRLGQGQSGEHDTEECERCASLHERLLCEFGAFQKAIKNRRSAAFLPLRFEYEDRGLLLVVSCGGNVIPVELRGPKGGSGKRPRRNFCNLCVVIRILLLVYEHVANVGVSAPGNVHTLVGRIEINAVHSLDRRKLRNFLPGRGVHHNHFRRISGANHQPMGSFIPCPISGTFTAYGPSGADLALPLIDHLNLAGNRVEYEQRLSGLVH